MTLGGPALLLAAAAVGFGHAVLPDHWVPLAVVGRTRRYSLARVGRLSLMAGITHVLVSVVLGAIVIAVGLQFRHAVQSVQDLVVGLILVATGLAFAVLQLTGHGHHHDHADGDGHSHAHAHTHDHAHDHSHDHADPPGRAHAHEPRMSIASVIIPFGAAASPDLTILPVFLAATASGVSVAVGSLVIFAIVTVGTIVTLTLIATRGGYQVRGQWLERWGNGVTALALLVIGGLVATGVL